MKLSLDDVVDFSKNSAATTTTLNNDKIEVAFENTLSRDGTLPNQMSADIDMNSNDLLNVGTLTANKLIISGQNIINVVVNGISIRTVLTANTIWYVRTDGSNANDGTANSSSKAWLTLQYAYDWIRANVDPRGFTMTVQIGDGTYTAGVSASGYGNQITFQGNGSTPSNVLIVPAAVFGVFAMTNGATITVRNLKIDSNVWTVAFYVSTSGQINLTGTILLNRSVVGGTCTYIEQHGRFISSAAFTITNSAGSQNNLVALTNGFIKVSGLWTVGGLAFAAPNAFVYCQWNAMVDVSAMTFSGTFTGKLFDIRDEGFLITSNGTGNLSFLPGTVAGTNLNGYYS